MTFGQRPRGGQGVRVEDVWERNVLHRRNKSESPRAGVGGQVRKSREAGVEESVGACRNSPDGQVQWMGHWSLFLSLTYSSVGSP